eukprot:JP447582.1.p3 GENE.JP447582.1~~JP447582.1.p3  ORF type:complete len:157 (+),score=63.01 JP447582.1:35-505(+)
MDTVNEAKAATRGPLIKIFDVLTCVAGVLICIAGVMAFWWGTGTFGAWPPYKWNGCIGGIFIFGFGLTAFWLVAVGGEFISTWFKFLDVYLGRGCYFVYLGLRIIPMGQAFCLTAGGLVAIFGAANIIVHFLFEVESIAGETTPLMSQYKSMTGSE